MKTLVYCPRFVYEGAATAVSVSTGSKPRRTGGQELRHSFLYSFQPLGTGPRTPTRSPPSLPVPPTGVGPPPDASSLPGTVAQYFSRAGVGRECASRLGEAAPVLNRLYSANARSPPAGDRKNWPAKVPRCGGRNAFPRWAHALLRFSCPLRRPVGHYPEGGLRRGAPSRRPRRFHSAPGVAPCLVCQCSQRCLGQFRCPPAPMALELEHISPVQSPLGVPRQWRPTAPSRAGWVCCGPATRPRPSSCGSASSAAWSDWRARNYRGGRAGPPTRRTWPSAPSTASAGTPGPGGSPNSWTATACGGCW
jgi:hypothetical protein